MWIKGISFYCIKYQKSKPHCDDDVLSCLSQVVSLVVQPALVHFALEALKSPQPTGPQSEHREETSFTGFREVCIVECLFGQDSHSLIFWSCAAL